MSEVLVPRAPTQEETTKILAEAAKAAAETRKLTAEAAAAEAELRTVEIRLAKAEEDEAQRLQSDEHRRVYRFSGPVSDQSANSCMAKLTQWDRLDPGCEIEIIFNSPGGSVIAGMALFDLISSLSLRGGGTHRITCGSLGFAASMAGILLQAGDHRWIGRQSYLMIHEISAGTSGKIGEIQDNVKFYEAVCSRVVDIFVRRSEGKISKARFIKGWKRIDWWLLSDEALKLGFVDEVR